MLNCRHQSTYNLTGSGEALNPPLSGGTQSNLCAFSMSSPFATWFFGGCLWNLLLYPPKSPEYRSMQGYTPHPLCFSQNTNLTPMFSSHQEFINQLDFINNLKKQMQQTRVYLDIIISFSVYLLVISFNSIIDWKSKFNLSWKYMYCHFRQ